MLPFLYKPNHDFNIKDFGEEKVVMEQDAKLSPEIPFLENALEMIILFNRDGLISYANASSREKLGYSVDLRGKNIIDIFPNDFKKAENNFTASDFGVDKLLVLNAYRENMTCFPVEVRIVENTSCPGTYICMANDILEKEFLNREIEHIRQEAADAMKVKSEFVANVTHELRTPVNGVLGNVREMLDDNLEAKTEKKLKLIERCCNDMNKIINSILDFSKLEAGKFTLEFRKFHFRDMLDYVKKNHLAKITEKGLDFFMTVSPQVPEYIIGDELRIVQILNNLLSNALKFTSVGKISVEVFRTAQVNNKIELFFVVSDTGIGIDKEGKSKLFESFSQVDASISRKYGGTGLGLNICRQLVELMGGKIDVESEKNRGSNFLFSIWVEACEGDKSLLQPDDVKNKNIFSKRDAEGSKTDTRKYGTKENTDILKKNLSKLILCVEMENWEKAEMFMETIKQLTQEAPQEVKRVALRLKMAIQKEDYEKVTEEHEALSRLIQ